MNKMLDFILAVENPLEWHRENLRLNYNHYSFLKYGGPENIFKIQDLFGSKVYFNTLIPTFSKMIKYGVISKESLVSDLLDWDTLYISGRLHKPVHMLYVEKDDRLRTALKLNLVAALHTALLLLPDSFSENDLYLTLASLSYSGDFRMIIGEDQNKVRNIVLPQMSEFRSLYSPSLQELKDFVLLDYAKGSGQQDTSPASRFFHLSMLPKRLQYELVREWNRNRRSRDLEDVLRAAAVDPDSNDIVLSGVTEIVKVSSFSQSAKGILTAGLMKSLRYSYNKVMKMWQSR